MALTGGSEAREGLQERSDVPEGILGEGSCPKRGQCTQPAYNVNCSS